MSKRVTAILNDEEILAIQWLIGKVNGDVSFHTYFDSPDIATKALRKLGIKSYQEQVYGRPSKN